MSIGEALAQERRQAGLTVAQVSQRTRIREAIVRGIENDDFSACGGDFYARGHIRNIARAIGADPEPFIASYEAARGPVPPGAAAGPIRLAPPVRERSRLNWTLALSLALLVAVGFGGYKMASHYLHGSPAAPVSRPQAAAASPSATVSPQAVATTVHRRRLVVIRLTAISPCWVQLTTAGGQVLFQGTVLPAQAEHWTERRPVQLRLGNPGGVVLKVNGHRRARGSAGTPVTLTLRPRPVG